MLIQAVGAGQLWQTRARGWEWDWTGVTEDQGLGRQGSNLAGRFKKPRSVEVKVGSAG